MSPKAEQPQLHSLIGQRIGKYRISRELARGGQGIVCEAVHEEIGHRAAVKLLPAELSKDPKQREYADRFFGEARAVNIVNHPGLVQIFDYGQLADGTVYILMEFLDGEPLGERLRKRGEAGVGPLALRDVLFIGRQVSVALSAAHEKGIVHRDLKPDNVFLVPDPDSPRSERVKVVDFGIAKFLDSPQRMTTAGVVLGTSLYMSPEQCQGTEQVSDRADVYALGVMLYELLAGVPPFEGGGTQVLRLHLFAEPPPLRSRRDGLPTPFYELIDQMLVKDPKVRPSMLRVNEKLREMEDAIGEDEPARAGKTMALVPLLPARSGAHAAPTRRSGAISPKHPGVLTKMQGGIYLAWPALVAGTCLALAIGGLLATILR